MGEIKKKIKIKMGSEYSKGKMWTVEIAVYIKPNWLVPLSLTTFLSFFPRNQEKIHHPRKKARKLNHVEGW